MKLTNQSNGALAGSVSWPAPIKTNAPQSVSPAPARLPFKLQDVVPSTGFTNNRNGALMGLARGTAPKKNATWKIHKTTAPPVLADAVNRAFGPTGVFALYPAGVSILSGLT
jgi:hypothetical protein